MYSALQKKAAMTNSYKVAIEEGSNMIKVGTAIFGERNGR